MRYKIYIYGNHVGWCEQHDGLWAFDRHSLKALANIHKLIDVVDALDTWPTTDPRIVIDMVELLPV